METYSINVYKEPQRHYTLDEFEEALRYSALSYSTLHLKLTGATPQEDLQEVILKSIKVCQMAGINSNEHFKPLYVCDLTTGTIYTDWLMSKKGFSLVIMQLAVNEQTAKWLWQLADI